MTKEMLKESGIQIKRLAGARQKSNLVDCLRSPNANENTSNKQEIAE